MGPPLVGLIAIWGAGCGNSGDEGGESDEHCARDPGIQVPQNYSPTIDPAHFVSAVDHPFFPLVPGTVFVYEGTEDSSTVHEDFSVTQDKKTLLGVSCVVVHDQVTVDGQLEEDTFDWFAQDSEGSVWYFGEDTKELDANGHVTSTAGSWQAGVAGALPGVVMPAHPAVGNAYRQEYQKDVAEDLAEVTSTTETVIVPLGSFTDALMTKEWSPLEPCVVENKYYASGVGLVREKAVTGGTEELVLVSKTGP